jgi:endonuclease G, mitochondrial
LALFTAANVDWRDASRLVNGRRPTRRELTGIPDGTAEEWVTDPRIPDAHQLPDVFFTRDGAAFDKGHLVRRDDVCWGPSFDDIQMGNGDTYHTPNCSPQVAGFNQARQENWGALENMTQQQTRADRVCVFSGPVLAANDPVFVGRDRRGTARVQIPVQFWKIVVAARPDGPAAFGFLLEQDLSDVPTEFAVPDRWRTHVRPIAAIEELLGGLVELPWLRDHDAAETDEGRQLGERVAAGG